MTTAALKPVIRVQMLANDIPAYQQDFAVLEDAYSAAIRMAYGCDSALLTEHESDLVHYKIKNGFLRVFWLPMTEAEIHERLGVLEMSLNGDDTDDDTRANILDEIADLEARLKTLNESSQKDADDERNH